MWARRCRASLLTGLPGGEAIPRAHLRDASCARRASSPRRTSASSFSTSALACSSCFTSRLNRGPDVRRQPTARALSLRQADKGPRGRPSRTAEACAGPAGVTQTRLGLPHRPGHRVPQAPASSCAHVATPVPQATWLRTGLSETSWRPGHCCSPRRACQVRDSRVTETAHVGSGQSGHTAGAQEANADVTPLRATSLALSSLTPNFQDEAATSLSDALRFHCG